MGNKPIEIPVIDFDIPADDSGDVSYSPNEYYDVIYNAMTDALTAQNVTDGQSIPSSAVEYFKGVLLNESPFTDYVCYVGDSYQYWVGNNQQTAYEYCMAYGDLELSGTYFSGTADIVRMRLNGEKQVYYQTEQNISVNAPLFYSRSNLGQYSGIIGKDYIGTGVLVALLLGGVTLCLRKFLVPSS